MIDNNIFELGSVRDFTASGQDPACNHVFFVLSTLFQAFFERSNRWWQDKNAERVRELLFNLLRTLPVDFQQYIGACGYLVSDLYARCAVIVAKNLSRFQKFIRLAACQEVIWCRKEIFATVLFARPR